MSVELPFSEAVEINPPVVTKRGEIYPFVDMASVDPSSRSVAPVALRAFKGGGSRFQAGDTLMARITPCLENGKIARYVPDSAHASVSAHGSTEFYVIRGKEGVTDNEFAYYLTQSDGVRNRAIDQMSGTSGRQRVPIDAFDHIIVSLPPLSEQRAIAHILGTLDDKIELNRKLNQTLEEMARALFKSWFVDFDPVRAKLDGRWRPGESLPGQPADLFHLLPDRLAPSQLGEIPEGWRMSEIGDEVEVLGGGTPSTKVPGYWAESGYAFCTPKDMSTLDAPILLSTERCLTEAGVEKVSSGQLPAGTVLLSSRAPIGYVALAGIPVSVNQGIIAMGCNQRLPNSYIMSWTRANLPLIEASANGSTFLEISKRNFRNLPILVPDDRILREFDGFVNSLMNRITENQLQSRSSTTQRDALLPKLVSGASRVGKIPLRNYLKRQMN